MVILAAGATAAALSGMQLFGYNRENFMEDREQRLKKEFAERRFRVIQSDLWRRDVRSIVALTEKKMSILLLVNTLVLGFAVVLWTEGRLPESTPVWLTTGMQLAIAVAFLFLLVAIWLAMHAAVAAQSYQTRVLTQLVRLPIPSWQELEACRTYGSEFERVEPRQMFRVPFLCGKRQEGVAKDSAVPTRPAAGAGARGGEVEGDAGEVAGGVSARSHSLPATDPWGLERRGDHIYELGCSYGKDCASFRHIKLIRQAAVHWQTYEAWARASMSVGFNQLILGISYYVVGYTVAQNDEVMPGFVGVTILVASSYLVSLVDLTLSHTERALFQLALAFGPAMVLFAAYRWNKRDVLAEDTSEIFAPVAFISHALVVGLMTVLVKVHKQENGALLPLAFQGVLFLDVFGWVWHKHATLKEGAEVSFKGASPLQCSTLMGGRPKDLCDDSRPMSYYAEDYVASWASRPSRIDEEPESEPSVAYCEQVWRPAAACLAYDEAGHPLPARPDDLRPAHCLQDLRSLPGAPSSAGPVDAVHPSGKEFWQSTTFMPSEARGRVDSQDEQLDDGLIVTGHDFEAPGLVPWTIFRNVAAASSLVWLLAGLYYVLEATNATHIDPRPRIDPRPHGFFDLLDYSIHKFSEDTSRVESAILDRSGAAPAELLHVVWPYRGIALQSLACDGDGKRLVVSDGVSLYTAELSAGTRLGRSGRLRRPGWALRTEDAKAVFKTAPPCAALAGSGLQDVAVVCSEGGVEPCEALVLHDRGRRLSACPLSPRAAEAAGGFSGHLAQSWLQPDQAAPAAKAESARWLVLDANCSLGSGGRAAEALRLGCVAVGTSGGRVAKLQYSNTSGVVFPTDAYMAVRQLAGQQLPVLELLRVAPGLDERVGYLRQGGGLLLQVGGAAADPGAAATVPVRLPGSKSPSAFCLAGRALLAAGQGPDPRLWRLPLAPPTA